MQYNKLIGKIYLWIFIFSFLFSCVPTPSQLFIFESYDLKNNQRQFYTTDLYNPSKIERLNVSQCDDDLNPEPIFSPNGKYYACFRPSPLFIRDINNNEIAKLNDGDPKDPMGWTFQGWSPDSQHIMIGNTGSLVRPYEDLSIMKYDGTSLVQLVKSTSAMLLPSRWSPNGKYIAYQSIPHASGENYLILIDPNGKEVQRFNLLKLTSGDVSFAGSISWSPDSKKLALNGPYVSNNENYGWYILSMESGKITNLIPEGSLCGEDMPQWSPDGQKLLITAYDCKTHHWGDYFDDRIYAINSDGSNLKPLTNVSVGNAHWSPDGKFIIFDKYTNQGSEIFIMNADGTNQRNLLGNQNHVSFMQWITP